MSKNTQKQEKSVCECLLLLLLLLCIIYVHVTTTLCIIYEHYWWANRFGDGRIKRNTQNIIENVFAIYVFTPRPGKFIFVNNKKQTVKVESMLLPLLLQHTNLGKPKTIESNKIFVTCL